VTCPGRLPQEAYPHQQREPAERAPGPDGADGSLPRFAGQIEVYAPHLGLVSTESHVALAESCKGWLTRHVILSGLQGFR
jgi:hypothetical protein